MPLTRLDYYKYLFHVYGLRKGTITKSWHDPSIVDLSLLTDKPVTWGYLIDFSQDDVDTLLTDENGIPMIDYATLGKHYNPWFVGHIALGRFTKWKKSADEKDLERFRQLADWFIRTGQNTQNGLTWFYYFDWFNNHNKPWRSGLSQAHAVSTLLRAASVFNDQSYTDAARRAVDDMIAPIQEGGAAYHWPDGTISLEESIKSKPSSVVNGHLFSVFACWEAGRFFDNSRYEETATKGWQFILNRIDLFDLGYWSRYSLRVNSRIPDIASFHYHDVHIAQMKVSAVINGNHKFTELAERFTNYQQSSWCRLRALWHKRLAKIL
jgi:heparosan-N-sulfate-glucuronate 5-epimerase